jgi:hypothetical protein
LSLLFSRQAEKLFRAAEDGLLKIFGDAVVLDVKEACVFAGFSDEACDQFSILAAAIGLQVYDGYTHIDILYSGLQGNQE